MAATQKFSNSPLATFWKISPNQSGQRTMNIDTLSPHCMSGNMTIETCGEWFSRKSTGASSNYGIGSDGRVGGYVPESNRSWCTSSAAVDQRAVTIEVANHQKNPPLWTITEKAENTLIDLMADICTRNNIKQLLWRADKKLIGQVDKQNIVVHRWTSKVGKDCPGDYMFNRMGEFAERVNRILGMKGELVLSPSTEAARTSEDPETIVWNWLIDRGLNQYATAGVMGNMFAESSLVPNNLQNTYEKILGMSDEEYTTAVDNGTYLNFATDKGGYGLCQWTYHTRKQGLLDLARERGTSIADVVTQLVYLWKEMEGMNGFIQMMNQSDSVYEATRLFMVKFEAPADQSDNAVARRAKYSEEIYVRNSTEHQVKSEDMGKPEEVPFLVYSLANVLNVRSEPTTKSKIVDKITDKAIKYTIVEVSGSGSDKWYKLKSGIGWISAAYCEKV